MEEDKIMRFCIRDLPDLVVIGILKQLPSLSDLKALRLVSTDFRTWVDNYSGFYDKVCLRVGSVEVLNYLLENSRRGSQDHRLWTNLALQIEQGSYFLLEGEEPALHVKTIRLHLFPFTHLNWRALSFFPNLRRLEVGGSLALAFCLDVSPPDNLRDNLRSLHLGLSASGLKPQALRKFSQFLLTFTALDNLKITCEENRQFVFRQVVSYFAKRFQTSPTPSPEEVEDFETNAETPFFPLLGQLVGFCFEVEIDFSKIMRKRAGSLEELFFSSVTGLRTVSIGHNVEDFPFHKLTNLSSIQIHLSKFNFTSSFYADGSLFPNVTHLHLTLRQLAELQDCQIDKVFEFPGKRVREVLLDLPSATEKDSLEERNSIMQKFFAKFSNLKTVRFCNSLALPLQE